MIVLTNLVGTCSHDTNGDGKIEPGEMETSDWGPEKGLQG